MSVGPVGIRDSVTRFPPLGFVSTKSLSFPITISYSSLGWFWFLLKIRIWSQRSSVAYADDYKVHLGNVLCSNFHLEDFFN